MRWISILPALFLMVDPGCAPHRQPIPPPPSPTTPPPIPTPDLRSHLQGTWERTTRENKGGRMTFRSDGSVLFEGALESYNPGQWELDALGHELYLTLPHASDDSVAVFHLYLRDGVKALDRPRKRVTYDFDAETQRLNIAGWIYAKSDSNVIRMEKQPELE